MGPGFVTKIRRWNLAGHRDLGYFISSLIIIYCISGIALNHIDDWNPDFIIEKKAVRIDRTYTKAEIDPKIIRHFSTLVGEDDYKVYDFPTGNQVKIYYNNATLHINLEDRTGHYENLAKRPVFYQANVLHRNSLKGWKWASDVFAVLLIIITITGLFILKGKYGFKRRGVWWMLAGFVFPAGAIVLFYYLSGR